MWVSDDWADYEILDATDKEKLERWGDVLLIRPDPQAIWQSGRKHPLWEKAHARYIRSNKGGGVWEFYRPLEDWLISYKGLRFALKPFSFKHTGLFPEQAVNWEFIYRTLSGNDLPVTHFTLKSNTPVSVLNLFAYTGGASLAAAAAGASVVHVDASKGMVSWAKENALHSGLAGSNIRWLVDDCQKFVQREIRRHHTYDAIILDPPSYGRGPDGEVWQMEDKIFGLLKDLNMLLSDRPKFVLLSSYTTGLSASTLKYLAGLSIGKTRNCKIRADELGLPVKDSGLSFPCGASVRIEFI